MHRNHWGPDESRSKKSDFFCSRSCGSSAKITRSVLVKMFRSPSSNSVPRTDAFLAFLLIGGTRHSQTFLFCTHHLAVHVDSPHVFLWSICACFDFGFFRTLCSLQLLIAQSSAYCCVLCLSGFYHFLSEFRARVVILPWIFERSLGTSPSLNTQLSDQLQHGTAWQKCAHGRRR